MGNLLACGAPIRVTSVGSVKPCSYAQLVLGDGTIQHMTLTTPVTVAELMLEHPSYFVCHVSQDGSEFERDRAMPADAELESGEIYYLRSKTGLSMSSKSPLRQLKRAASESDKGGVIQQAFRMMQRGPVTQVVVSADCVAQVLSRQCDGGVDGDKVSGHEDEKEKVVYRLSAEDLDNPELQMAYQMRLVSRSVSWKPKLATIEES